MTHRWMLLLAVLAVAGSCEKPVQELPPPVIEQPDVPDTPDTPSVPGEVTYTLMSYNVGVFKKYETTLGHYSYPEVASIIKGVGAQVAGLNETDWEAERSGGDRQVDMLATALGKGWTGRFWFAHYNWYGNSMVWDGNALKVVKEHPRMRLAKTDGAEVRSMGAVEFKDFVYCVTHLDHVSATDRLSGVETITKWAKENYSNASKPVFLVGDMNATPTSETVQKLQEDWVWISPDRNTFPSRTLTKCIDYILVLKNGYESKVEVTASGVVTSSVNPQTYNASDHCPVWVTAKWNTAQ